MHLKRLKTVEVKVGWRKKKTIIIETIQFHFKVIQNHLKQMANDAQHIMKNKMIAIGAIPVNAIFIKIVYSLIFLLFWIKQSKEMIIYWLYYIQFTGEKIAIKYDGYDKFIESVWLTT